MAQPGCPVIVVSVACAEPVLAMCAPGAPVLVEQRADFKVRWAATHLHLFAVVAAVLQITPEVIATYTTQVLTYARKFDH